MNFSWRIYRRLAQAFPHEFKMAFGDDMLLAGEEATRQLARQQCTAGSLSLFVIGMALLACYLPARSATRLNPLQAFRQE